MADALERLPDCPAYHMRLTHGVGASCPRCGADLDANLAAALDPSVVGSHAWWRATVERMQRRTVADRVPF